jgi:phospholipase D-like protein/putative oligomerization/nucleic acid binding protein
MSDYPLLGLFWSMLIFFLWISWFMLLFRIIGDVFRRRDIGGGSKVLWLIFVIVLPFLGVFVYLITQNAQMSERDDRQLQAAQERFDDHVRSVAASAPADEISKAKALLDAGAIDAAEFEQLKAAALSHA